MLIYLNEKKKKKKQYKTEKNVYVIILYLVTGILLLSPSELVKTLTF